MSTSSSPDQHTARPEHPTMVLLIPVLCERGPGHHMLISLPYIACLADDPRYRVPVPVVTPTDNQLSVDPAPARRRSPNGQSLRQRRKWARQQREAETARLIRLNVQRAIANGGLIGRRWPGSFSA